MLRSPKCKCILYCETVTVGILCIHYLLYVRRCRQLPLDDIGICSSVTESVNFYFYNYTQGDAESFTRGLRNIYNSNLTIYEDEYCRMAALRFVCNYVLIPCDLHTGNPRLICSSICDYIVNKRCISTFVHVNVIGAGFRIILNCSNPLLLLQEIDHSVPDNFTINENCIQFSGKL